MARRNRWERWRHPPHRIFRPRIRLRSLDLSRTPTISSASIPALRARQPILFPRCLNSIRWACPGRRPFPREVSGVSATAVTTSSALIAWATDQAGDDRSAVRDHDCVWRERVFDRRDFRPCNSAPLAGLTPGTTYHYRVKSVTAAGDITFSGDHTFTTLSAGSGGGTSAPASTTPPAAVTTLSVAAHDRTSATLTWNVGSAGADLAAEYDIRYSTQPITQNNFASATQDQETLSCIRIFRRAAPHARTSWRVLRRAAPIISRLPRAMNQAIGRRYQTSFLSRRSAARANRNRPAARVLGSVGGVGSPIGSTAVAGPIAPPTVTSAAGNEGQITIDWNNPNTTSFVRTLIVRKEGEYPSSPSDGVVIYDGRGTTFTDTNVQNGVTYYYAIYSYDRAKNYSNAVRVSLAPTAGGDQLQLNENPTITTGVHYTLRGRWCREIPIRRSRMCKRCFRGMAIIRKIW